MTIQDFSVIKTRLNKIKEDLNLQELTDAFYIMAIGAECDLQDTEIRDCITDNSFLVKNSSNGGHDRGIDAIYIENNSENNGTKVHLFNCKCAATFEQAKKSFPSSEIEKIVTYIDNLMDRNENWIENANSILKEKTKEIWDLFDNGYPEFYIHICSNLEKGMDKNEFDRMQKSLSKYSDIKILQHNIDHYVKISNYNKITNINAKFKVAEKELFEKSDGDIRALIVNVRADELIRIIIDDEEIRNNVNFEDYEIIKEKTIIEDVFYDNVRLYKKNKTRINKGIIATAESKEENSKFFYYNNGITVTCTSFSFPKISQPTITIENMQIVNGSQTLHALFEVAQKNIECLKNIEILCRIYELKDAQYSSRIAEYTNSQNPVTSRDIRSIDFVQQKLEMELKDMGYFYERKTNQYENEAKERRIDSEKAGQAMLAFYYKCPNEAKNNKTKVFGDKFEVIFNENITAEELLKAFEIYSKVENRKDKVKKEIVKDNNQYEENSFVLYATYFIVYILGEIKDKLEVNNGLFENYYTIAFELMKKVVESEKELKQTQYTNANFFKSIRPQQYIDKYFKILNKNITSDSISKLPKIELE